jgi:antitoxin component YwqK of YwqJK toxin-antitoxin module
MATLYSLAHKKVWLASTLTLAIVFLSEAANAWPWNWNRYDKKQLKHGRWRTFHDAEEKVVHYRGKYRHGKEVGQWKTFTPDGKLYFTERIKRRSRSYQTVYYHPNGKVSHKGMAYMRDAEKGGVHFYWEGDWEYFDQEGKSLGIKTFVKGEPTTDMPVLGSIRKAKE